MKEEEKRPEIYWKPLTAKNSLNVMEIVLVIKNYNPLILPENIPSYAAIVNDKDEDTETTIIFTNKLSIFFERLP